MEKAGNEIPWGDATWSRIECAIQDEVRRVTVAQRFLPLTGPRPEATTVPADPIRRDGAGRLVLDEAAVSPLCEIWTEFALTPQQVAEEERLMKARTLAIRAARLVTLAEDALIFDGRRALTAYPLLKDGIVRHRSGPPAASLPELARTGEGVETLEPVTRTRDLGRAVLRAVERGYAKLQDRGHYGPYALVLSTRAHAAVLAPPDGTFIFEADRLRSLFARGLFGTGTLPDEAGAGALLFSLGGESMDLVIGRPATVSFLQEDDDGKYRFRVWKRFAFRLRDPSAVIAIASGSNGTSAAGPAGAAKTAKAARTRSAKAQSAKARPAKAQSAKARSERARSADA
jgi:uncharacterized linocin/CFP29 family protein